MSKRMRNFIIGSAIAVVLCAVYIFWAVAMQGKSSATTLTIVQQPPTAASVAQQAGCTNFLDKGPSEAGGVVDSGSCDIFGVKYGIDTFASQTARDSWLVMAEKYSVNPKWETATSVVYKSVN